MLHLHAHSLSLSLDLLYPSLLRNSRSERSRRLIQYTTGVSARKVVEKTWWEKHAVGPNSARAASLHVVGGRSGEQRDWGNEFVSGIRSGNIRARSKVRKSSGVLFLFFEIPLANVSDPIDLFAALIKYRVQLSADTIEREKYLRRVREEDIILMNWWMFANH